MPIDQEFGGHELEKRVPLAVMILNSTTFCFVRMYQVAVCISVMIPSWKHSLAAAVGQNMSKSRELYVI